jgi:hypothetical protein
MFATLASSRLGGLGGGFALAHLHTGFFIASIQQPAFFVGFKRFGVMLEYVLGLGIKVLIVAIHPILALVRLEIDILKNPPEA